VGDSISISDRASQKDIAAGDRVYPARRHDGGGVTRSGGARCMVGRERAGSMAPMLIDVVEMGKSTQ
jgi:hypothetical protein